MAFGPTSGATSDIEFESHRRSLRGIAYRMLGSVSDAEDVVQETWLRWQSVDRDGITQPRAFLTKTLTNLCLDQLKSARLRRESYVGPWLPEPVVEEQGLLSEGADAATELASDLSYAFLIALERLTPAERAVFLLHDVFDEDFTAIATALERTPTSCRQLAARARNKIREAKPRFAVARENSDRIAAAFLNATQSGDFEAIKNLLTDDVQLISDGGGQVAAAGIPVLGSDRVAKFLSGLRAKHPLPVGAHIRPAIVNGLSGCIVSYADGRALQTVAIDVRDDGKIGAIYIVRNPDKLKHL